MKLLSPDAVLPRHLGRSNRSSCLSRLAVGSSTDSIALSAVRLAAPANGDRYGIGWTDLRAVATVDALGRSVRQALPV